jgi:hypothetical protein
MVENRAVAKPCTQRPAISRPMLPAAAHKAEPSPNSSRPTIRIRRRPTMSPSRPKAISGATSASVKPLTTHCSSVVPAPNARPIAGSATVIP